MLGAIYGSGGGAGAAIGTIGAGATAGGGALEHAATSAKAEATSNG